MLLVSLLFVSPFLGLIAGTASGLIGWFYMKAAKNFHREIVTIK